MTEKSASTACLHKVKMSAGQLQTLCHIAVQRNKSRDPAQTTIHQLTIGETHARLLTTLMRRCVEIGTTMISSLKPNAVLVEVALTLKLIGLVALRNFAQQTFKLVIGWEQSLVLIRSIDAE